MVSVNANGNQQQSSNQVSGAQAGGGAEAPQSAPGHAEVQAVPGQGSAAPRPEQPRGQGASTAADSPAHAPGMPVVTVLGDGQLARMMQTEAIELGLSVRLLAGSADASAAQVTQDVVLGDYTALDDLLVAVAGADAVTFDHEHVPNEHLETLLDRGVNVDPGPHALIYAQDKLLMRQHLAALGLPIPDFAEITSVADAENFARRVDGNVCLKARRGGYDGHGVWFPDSSADATELTELVAKFLDEGVPLMAERKVQLARELSAMAARTPSGEVKTWPVVESVQRDGICAEAFAPADRQDATEIAETVARELEVTGVLAVELFEDAAGKLWVNELATRPHNTGHWTQDGAVTSQFEQHLRAVLDLPLGSTELTAPHTVMANVLGGEKDPDVPIAQRMAAVWRRFPDAKIHLYGKSYRPGRKLGHVNVSGTDAAETRRRAQLAAHYLVAATWADGFKEQ